MCDAAGEPPDRLEPLSLAQLLLELLALADVAADRLGPDRDAVLEDQPARDLDLDPASVLGYELALVDRSRICVASFRSRAATDPARLSRAMKSFMLIWIPAISSRL